MTQLYSHTLSCPFIQVGRRTIINKLFFDLAQEEESVLDAEFLKVPGIYVILLHCKPSENLLSVPSQGGCVNCGDRVWREICRGFKAEGKRAKEM